MAPSVSMLPWPFLEPRTGCCGPRALAAATCPEPSSPGPRLSEGLSGAKQPHGLQGHQAPLRAPSGVPSCHPVSPPRHRRPIAPRPLAGIRREGRQQSPTTLDETCPLRRSPSVPSETLGHSRETWHTGVTCSPLCRPVLRPHPALSHLWAPAHAAPCLRHAVPVSSGRLPLRPQQSFPAPPPHPR